MARNLQSQNTAQAINPLLQAIRLEDQLARQKEIAYILKKFDKDRAVSLLFDALLKSPDSESRKRIAEELVKIGSDKAVEMLETIMTHDFDPEVQREAIKALRQIGSNKAVDTLLSTLRSNDEWGLAWEAAHALGDFNSDKVVDALIEASKNYFVADTAVSSLIKIGSDRAVEGLIKIMHDMMHGTGLTTYNAMRGLVQLGTEKAIDSLFQVWNGADSIHRMRLHGILYQFKPKNLIAPLCQRLRNKTFASDCRMTAADLLGIVGTENEIPLLESVWHDPGDDRDVSWRALKAAEQISFRELKRKAERERVLEETRAFIAHEVKSAIGPLRVVAQLLDEAVQTPTLDRRKLAQYAQRILGQTEAAYEVVNQYLDYAKPLKPKYEPTDINELIRQGLDEIRAKCAQINIEITEHFDPEAHASVDRSLIAQVLRNILDNAVEAMEYRGKLTITTRHEGSQVTIQISDTGTGIKPDILHHVFELGFTTKLGRRGAGIGLALARRIVSEGHDGNIAIANNSDGLGATVTISLPVTKETKSNDKQNLAPIDS
jgi:signal transduction histidine kinase